MATTPVYALPYPLGTDLVRDGDNVIQALAERVEALIAQRDVQAGHRNVIRNGDFRMAQRGAGPFTGTSTYTIDGWLLWYVGGSVNVQQGTSVATIVNGGEEATRYALTGATGQGAAGDYCFLSHRIEGVTTFNGRQVTLSFMGWASNPAKFGIEVSQAFGAGGSTQVNTTIQAVDVTGTIGRKSVTFTVPSVAGKTVGTDGKDNVSINFWFSAGATNAARASNIGIQNNNFALADVQLEAGPLATPFERLPQALQVVWNQRYFIRKNYLAVNSGVCNGAAWAQNSYYGVIHFPTMRAGPAITPSAVTHFSVWSNTVSAVTNNMIFTGTSPDSCEWSATTSATGPGTGLGVWVRSAVAGAYLDLNAEV